MNYSTIENEFLSDLTSSIELTEKKNLREPSKKYKPSAMNCIRNMYFQMTGQKVEDNDKPYFSIGIAETGTDRHIRIQEAVSHMRENGFDCDYLDVETYIKDFNIEDIDVVRKNGAETLLYNKRYNMSFACDGLIRYKGQYYIIEFKTEGQNKFNRRIYVDDSHLNQASAYSLSLKLDGVLFIYICRDNLNMKAYLLNVTDTMRERIISKIEQCDLYIENNTVPPKESSYKNCTYCQYKNYCDSL